MKKTGKLIILLFAVMGASAFLKPKHSSLTIEVAAAKGCKALLTFQVTPDEDMKLTPKAPWSLAIAKESGFAFTNNQKEYKSKDLDTRLPGFNVTAELQDKKKLSGELHYEVRSFVCAKDGSKCFPELHKGTRKWQLDAKKLFDCPSS